VKRTVILGLALIAMLAIGVGVAFAAHKYRTKIVFLGNSGPTPTSSDQTFYGDLKSPSSKCLGARKMGLFKKTKTGDYKLLDVDLSSYNGAWALRADINGKPELAITVQKVKRNHGKVVCGPDTFKLLPPPPP
jgi:hypothetical protein